MFAIVDFREFSDSSSQWTSINCKGKPIQTTEPSEERCSMPTSQNGSRNSNQLICTEKKKIPIHQPIINLRNIPPYR